MSTQARTLAIIGSSNVRRIFGGHIPHLSAHTGCEAVFKGATTFTTGSRACQNLKENDMAIISFLTNTLVDECGMALEGEFESKILDVLVKYVDVIKAIPKTVTVIILYPFPRVEPTWVFEWIDFIHKKLDESLDTLGPHVRRFPYLKVTKDDYEEDFTHLKMSVCDKQYLDFCNTFARVFSTDSEVIDEFEMISPRSDAVQSQSQSTGINPSNISLTEPSTSQSAGAGVRSRANQYGNVPPQLTPNNQRNSSRVQLPNVRQTGTKRPASGATGGSDFYGAKNTRLNSGQFYTEASNDFQQSNGSEQRKQNNWNSNPTNNNGNNKRNRNQWAPNPGPSGLDKGGNGRGRGSVSGNRGTRDTNLPRSSQVRVTNTDMEVRMTQVEKQSGKLIMEMITNYELTETALNKINATSVIIDCLPFGSDNSNDPPVEVVRDFVVSLGGSESHVAEAFFLNGGPTPSRGTFARIRAIFSSEKSAFDFRMEATAARRRRVMPWANTFVSNDPTKGTRVRIEILQQLAKAAQATVEGKDADILVSKFEPRPMLLFKRGGRVYNRMNYSEALIRFGRLVAPQAYELAKRIAGREYEGRMDVVFGI